jgi:phosphoketolase
MGSVREELHLLDAYWRAANYLSVGQIYLLANPLLHEPLAVEDIKPRLLGHWGTTPGLNFVYAHLNRVIRARDLNVIYVTGPGHGGPGLHEHPHGLSEREFDALFTAQQPVIFAYHGYPWLIHRLTYRRTNHHNPTGRAGEVA